MAVYDWFGSGIDPIIKFYISGNELVITDIWDDENKVKLNRINRDLVKAIKEGITIVLPSSVNTIGKEVFSSLNMSGIKLPSGMYSIGDEAFEYCNKLKKINFGENLISIGNATFKY